MLLGSATHPPQTRCWSDDAAAAAPDRNREVLEPAMDAPRARTRCETLLHETTTSNISPRLSAIIRLRLLHPRDVLKPAQFSSRYRQYSYHTRSLRLALSCLGATETSLTPSDAILRRQSGTS